MAKTKSNTGNTLLDMVMQRTQANLSSKGGGSGRTTYLDRFVDVLTDEDGNPVEGMTRNEITAHISFQIIQEQVEADKAAGKREEDFQLTEAGDTADDLLLAKVNKKVKAQVASAIANNNNSTSLSFNPAYKDKWRVVKAGDKVSLEAITSEE